MPDASTVASRGLALETDSGQRVVIRNGRIAIPSESAAVTLALGPGELRPGLINAHDHLLSNHYPRLGAPPYRNSYEWAEDVQRRFADQLARFAVLSEREAFLFGALKNLAGGVTTVVHHGNWRNTFDRDPPLRVARVLAAHSLRLERNWSGLITRMRAHNGMPICLHMAEGVDETMALEIEEAAAHGVVNERLLAVHLVGVDARGIALLRRAGAAAVWCPTSNGFLYGRTAPRQLFESGIDVLLGTDSLASGDGTLLDELAAARAWRYLSDSRLADAVGRVAARRLGLREPSLEPGVPADVVLLRRPLGEARRRDVGLVLVSGAPRFADASLAEVFCYSDGTAEPLVVDRVPKLVSAPLGRIARKVTALAPECERIFL